MITNLNDSPKLTTLLSDFYNLTGMKICIYDDQGEEISYYPDRLTPFCQYLRSYEEYDLECHRCDHEAISECRRTQQSLVYTCHSGLTECIAPILINDIIVGFIVIGQVREENTKLADLKVDNFEKLMANYEQLQMIRKDKILSALHIIEACASYEQLKEFVKKTSDSFAKRLQQFVDSNLTNTLDIQTLMEEFSLSRVELYRCVKYSFQCTPAEFVKGRRLHYAAKLLKTTSNSIYEIALACGIPDYNYFSKVFKKRYSMSPTKYRTINSVQTEH